MTKVTRRRSRLDAKGRRALRPLVELLDRRELLSGYNVRLNSPSEIGTSIAGQSQHYDHLADFQATDPNGLAFTSDTGFTALVNWGDGTVSTGEITPNYRGLSGLFDISGEHEFPNPGNGEYGVQVKLTDPAGGIWYARPSTATVEPRPDNLVVSPVGTDTFSVTTGQPFQGAVATIQVADPNVPLTGLTGVFDNGDGTQSLATIVPASPGPGWVVSDPHPFTRPGTYFIVLQLTDDQGDTPRVLQGHVMVTAPSPAPQPQPQPVGTTNELGSLSEQYESGGRGPGTVSLGRGDPGGVSYGTYQLSSTRGTVRQFVNEFYPTQFRGLVPGQRGSQPDGDR